MGPNFWCGFNSVQYLGDIAWFISSSCSTSTVIGDSDNSMLEVESKSGTETPRLGGREL